MTYDLADVERELCRIPEVRAARIVADSSGTPVEVHVLAAPGKHAKQVVRDIQSVAMATVGLSIDHRIVSVVQLDEPGAAPAAPAAAPPAPTPNVDAGPSASMGPTTSTNPSGPADAGFDDAPFAFEGADTQVIVLDDEPAPRRAPAPAPAVAPTAVADDLGRVIVERVIILRRGLTCTAEVVLRRGDDIVTGDADGSSASGSTLRLAAEATLDGLRQLHPAAGRAALETVQLTRSAERMIVLTTLVLVVPPNEELVTGSAPVRGTGEHEAVARSVLDAVNRRLHDRP